MSDAGPGEPGDLPRAESPPPAAASTGEGPAAEGGPRPSAGAPPWWDLGRRPGGDDVAGSAPVAVPAGTAPGGVPPWPTPPWGTPPSGTAPWGTPPWATPAGGAPPWGPPPPWYGWAPGGWPRTPAAAQGAPSAWEQRRRSALPWVVVGTLLAVIALVGIGLGIGFSVWGTAAPAASSAPAVPTRPAQPATPRIGSSTGRGGFLGVEIIPSPFFRPGASATGTATRAGAAPRTGSGTGSGSPGAHVAGVVATSPAAKAGIVKGDTITAFDGHRIATALTLQFDVSSDAPGQRATVSWTTVSGKHESAAVTLAKKPSARSIG